MNAYGPAEIHTLNPDTVPFAEHPDHIYTARIAREAALDLPFDAFVYYHQTYPTSPASANVGSADALLKTEITATYYAGSNGMRRRSRGFVYLRRQQSLRTLDTPQQVPPSSRPATRSAAAGPSRPVSLCSTLGPGPVRTPPARAPTPKSRWGTASAAPGQ